MVDETFSTISGEHIPNVFQIIIEKANEEIEPLDTKVSSTIEDIIDCFFVKIENALIYICSDADKKAKARQDVFERWYKKSTAKEHIIKIDKLIQIRINDLEIQKLYTAFMFHKNNPNFEKLLDVYNKIEEVLNNDK